MDAERENLLNSIGFVWSSLEKTSLSRSQIETSSVSLRNERRCRKDTNSNAQTNNDSTKKAPEIPTEFQFDVELPIYYEDLQVRKTGKMNSSSSKNIKCQNYGCHSIVNGCNLSGDATRETNHDDFTKDITQEKNGYRINLSPKKTLKTVSISDPFELHATDDTSAISDEDGDAMQFDETKPSPKNERGSELDNTTPCKFAEKSNVFIPSLISDNCCCSFL